MAIKTAKKLSAAQVKALAAIRSTGGLTANGLIAARFKITFATLESLRKLGLVSGKLVNDRWDYSEIK